jgi:hypothetical protein
MPPGLVDRLNGRFAQALALLDGLAARLAATRAGFAALPLRDDAEAAAATAPAPVALEPVPP